MLTTCSTVCQKKSEQFSRTFKRKDGCMEKLNLKFYKDGKDLIVVVKDCDKSLLDVLRCFSASVTMQDVVEIPPLAPVKEKDEPMPKIPKESPRESVKEEGNTAEEKTEKNQEEKKDAEPVSDVEVPISQEANENVSESAEPSSDIICPNCGKALKSDDNGISCDCGFKLRRVNSQRHFTDEELKSLIETGKTPVFDDFISKAGKKFAASLSLRSKKTGSISFNFQ